MNRYRDISINRDPSGKRKYLTTKYPEIPRGENDTYVISTEGDKFDILALRYYSDSSLWWVISIANPELGFGSLYITPGKQVRIPSNLSQILNSYEQLNS